jgi:hypothetical protein
LLTLARTLLLRRLRLLFFPLILYGLPSGLRWGLRWDWPLHLFDPSLRRLSAWDDWTALLALVALLAPLRRRGGPLPFLLLILLPHYGVTWLITVILVVNLLLLLPLGIAIP